MINRAELELTVGGKITGRLGRSMSVTSKFGKASALYSTRPSYSA